MAGAENLRQLPSVHEVLEQIAPQYDRFPRPLLTAEVRRVLEEIRNEIRAGNPVKSSWEERIQQSLEDIERPSLRHVINATGVVLHTNLGRAPLGRFAPVPGYSNLEYDLTTGRRGKRDVHAGRLLQHLLGTTAIVVNNNAAAVYLAVHELANGGEVIVSRGELIEIGDGFRIPEIVEHSGAVLREVGATNRTHLDDYRDAINERTRLLLRVHPSNFQIQGFTARPDLSALAALAREHGIPLYEDLGSGCLVDLRPFGIAEPLISESLAAGVDLVSASGDKLLGGPQAGILAGKPELVARLRRNPMYRALRLDKVICQALETALRNLLLENSEAVPILAMIRQSKEEIRARASALLRRVPLRAELIDGQSVLGGGSTPGQSLPTCLIALTGIGAVEAEERLRTHTPSVIARIEKDRLLLDLRTVFREEEDALVAALAALE